VIERDGKAAAKLVLVPAVEEPAEKKEWRIGGQTLWALRMLDKRKGQASLWIKIQQ
jgi:hypothetical protein